MGGGRGIISVTTQLSFRGRGIIPLATSLLRSLRYVHLANNHLTGPLPASLLIMTSLNLFDGSGNQLSGTLPAMSCEVLRVTDNQLTGLLPQNLHAVSELLASGNCFEGTVPGMISCNLRTLVISGQSGNMEGLRGPLPFVIARARLLFNLFASRHRLEGVIPPFAATLWRLGLQNNKFQLMSEAHLCDAKRSNVFVHNNFLSCHLPVCGDRSVEISLASLGNELSWPNRGFPKWVSPMDRDRLLYTGDHEGRDLLLKAAGASGLLAIASATMLVGNRLSRWYAQAGWHFQLTLKCSHLLADVAQAALLGLLVLMLLLAWNLYRCPRTLALASTCLRDDTLTHALTLLMWLHFMHGCASQVLTTPGKKVADRGPSKKRPFLLPVLFVLLQVLLSLPAVMLQVCRSVPRFFADGEAWVVAISVGIGAVQAVLGTFVVPHLSRKLTSQRHVYTLALHVS